MTARPDRVLVVAGHPDDEVLGCGATAARWASEGAIIHTLIVGEGAMSREGADREHVERLRAASVAAAVSLGVAAPFLRGLPDNRLDTLPLLDLVRLVEQAIAATTPDTVLTHFPGDLNVDHRLVASAVLAATRPGPSAVREVLAFEVASSTEWAFGSPAFAPNVFVDVAGAPLAAKLGALEAHYAEELRPFPHPRSLEALRALAAWRGATAGVVAAEAFMLLRGVR